MASTSFRDPAGFIFQEDGTLLRQVNKVYEPHFNRLCDSGLAQSLIDEKLLIGHEIVDGPVGEPHTVYRILKPERVDFISYPYEWSFSQYKDAALLTLEIQRRAIDRGMTLKDSSAYNVQFKDGRPLLIDTLSFEVYEEGQPWVAYRQFCQHFLAPLALMSLTDHRLNQLCRANLDGIPLDLAARLLPNGTMFRFGLLVHLHLHAMFQRSASKDDSANVKVGQKRLSRNALLGMIDSLESAVKRLSRKPGGMGWADYYRNNTYTSDSIEHKKRLVAEYLTLANPARVWDLGSNVGDFSRIASDRGIPTVSFDIDPECVEANYLESRRRNETRLLPLVMDLSNPSPGLGWMGEERSSFIDRANPELAMALALVHHLVFSCNQPLENVAEFFRRIAPRLIIEFVPKDDPQAIRLLRRLDGKHHEYDQAHFESCFKRHFEIRRSEPIPGSGRILYLMTRRERAC